jgi:hypothetical protein
MRVVAKVTYSLSSKLYLAPINDESILSGTTC